MPRETGRPLERGLPGETTGRPLEGEKEKTLKEKFEEQEIKIEELTTKLANLEELKEQTDEIDLLLKNHKHSGLETSRILESTTLFKPTFKSVHKGIFVVQGDITFDGGGTIFKALTSDVILDVYVQITEVWDGDGLFTVGDAGDPDGFMTGAGITQGTLGWYGGDVSARGAYLASGDRKAYSADTNINPYRTVGTSTTGKATIYIVIERLT